MNAGTLPPTPPPPQQQHHHTYQQQQLLPASTHHLSASPSPSPTPSVSSQRTPTLAPSSAASSAVFSHMTPPPPASNTPPPLPPPPSFPFSDRHGIVHGPTSPTTSPDLASAYRIEGVRAKGSFSTVLLATCLRPPVHRPDLAAGARVALKCIARGANPAAVAAQRREADLLMRLQPTAPSTQVSSSATTAHPDTPVRSMSTPVVSGAHRRGASTGGVPGGILKTPSGGFHHATRSPSPSPSPSPVPPVGAEEGEEGSLPRGSSSSSNGRATWGVVGMYESIETETHLVFVLEYLETDLFGLIMKSRPSAGSSSSGGLPPATVRLLFDRIVRSVQFCHDRGVYHRDLKPENILVDPTDYTVRLADFGLATDKSWSFIQACGSVRYMSPECLGVDALSRAYPKSDEDGEFPASSLKLRGFASAPNDVWALGIILLNMLFAQHPWSSPGDDACMEAFIGEFYRREDVPAAVVAAAASARQAYVKDDLDAVRRSGGDAGGGAVARSLDLTDTEAREIRLGALGRSKSSGRSVKKGGLLLHFGGAGATGKEGGAGPSPTTPPTPTSLAPWSPLGALVSPHRRTRSAASAAASPTTPTSPGPSPMSPRATAVAPKMYPPSILIGMFGIHADLDAALRWCFHPDPVRRPPPLLLLEWVLACRTFRGFPGSGTDAEPSPRPSSTSPQDTPADVGTFKGRKNSLHHQALGLSLAAAVSHRRKGSNSEHNQPALSPASSGTGSKLWELLFPSSFAKHQQHQQALLQQALQAQQQLQHSADAPAPPSPSPSPSPHPAMRASPTPSPTNPDPRLPSPSPHPRTSIHPSSPHHRRTNSGPVLPPFPPVSPKPPRSTPSPAPPPALAPSLTLATPTARRLHAAAAVGGHARSASLDLPRPSATPPPLPQGPYFAAPVLAPRPARAVPAVHDDDGGAGGGFRYPHGFGAPVLAEQGKAVSASSVMVGMAGRV
ncbi:hypothetical protein HDU96_007466 [Phlyctochytrium bullatum]|nr:hypothetical protein HDU96_007466 [Phlyctochytrium bullatum]